MTTITLTPNDAYALKQLFNCTRLMAFWDELSQTHRLSESEIAAIIGTLSSLRRQLAEEPAPAAPVAPKGAPWSFWYQRPDGARRTRRFRTKRAALEAWSKSVKTTPPGTYHGAVRKAQEA